MTKITNGNPACACACACGACTACACACVCSRETNEENFDTQPEINNHKNELINLLDNLRTEIEECKRSKELSF